MLVFIINCFGRVEDIMKNKSIVLILYFFVILFFEITAYAIGGLFSVIAAWIWFITGAILFFDVFCKMCMLLYKKVKEKKYFIVIAFLFLLFIFFCHIGNLRYSDISFESTQQVAYGLDSFNVKDLNYTKSTFLGLYNNRQYVLVAIPALIFGRNIWTLHAGFGFMFLFGLSVLFLEVMEFIKEKKLKEEYALIPCYSFLTFVFITEYYLIFEQTLIPVSLSMILVAFYLRFIRNPSLKNIVFLSWVGCFLSRTYTPSLAIFGLLLVFLVLCVLDNLLKNGKVLKKHCVLKKIINDKSFGIINNNKEKRSFNLEIIFLIFFLIIFFLVPIIFGTNDNKFLFDFNGALFEAIIASWVNFFTDSSASFLGVFSIVIIFYMVFSLLFRFKIYDFVISCWVLGVIVFSDYMVGYTVYEECSIMQRDMLVIPVLVVAIFIIVIGYIKKYNIVISNFVIAVILIVFTFFGVYNFGQKHQSFLYLDNVFSVKYLISYIEDTLDKYNIDAKDEFVLVVLTDNDLLKNIDDYAKFFFPNVKVQYNLKEDNKVMKNNNSNILIFSDYKIDLSDNGYDLLQNKMSLLKESHKKYLDRRTKTGVVWYRKVLIS